jgi:SAM-dependent methyltransferase
MNKFFLDLGVQPLANNFLKKYSANQPRYNLKLYFNTKSKMVSISKRIPSSVMFNSKYPYRSSMSSTMRTSFRQLSNEIKKKFNPKLLLEIGSNDGALLTNFDKDRAIGVEPCKNLAKITKEKKYYTYDDYWNFKLSSKIKKKFKEVDLIYSANTLTHISNLKDVFKSINLILSEEGVLIIEDPSLFESIKNNAYDQFYNEHIYVFSAIALKNLLKKFNLEIFDVKNLPTHGGSLRYFIKKRSNKKYNVKLSVKKQIDKEIKKGLDKFKTYKDFATKSTKSKKLFLELLNKIIKDNKKIIGYGATAKAVTVLNYCNIDRELIKNFTDTTPEKINTFLPGKNIKILGYKKDILKKYDYAFLGAWNFKKEIFKKEKTYINSGGKFITHVPFPRIIDK